MTNREVERTIKKRLTQIKKHYRQGRKELINMLNQLDKFLNYHNNNVKTNRNLDLDRIIDDIDDIRFETENILNIFAEIKPK